MNKEENKQEDQQKQQIELEQQENQNVEELKENNTLYVNNLNERVKIDDMKQCLQAVFEEYGEILQIHLKANIRMKGQAFIVFKEVQAAVQARKELNNIKLFGKQMKIFYAKNKSDIVQQKEDPNWVKPERPQSNLSLLDQLKKVREEKKALREQQKQKSNTGQPHLPDVPQKTKQAPKLNNQPNKVLFIDSLSPTVTQESLIFLFQQVQGFSEVRFIPFKKVAFVEFEDETFAGYALQKYNGQQFEGAPLSINYANK
ncbi:hypothetical protein PPERSA_08284 [Pseudocohnilembus persalinus]|uniref:RRM domain-containing protein n=1 Tax=Pseudocohnilembus persalinus TaxID=266149 RepID=A0A0V0QQ07_PSEPJ|nr:hypothetical protein PPERSA_08284 [Pseudocohnilembus persalinus]|eukprot:KRX04069.1 hypothetical protein PPERSA_08284 [Pseudocohnilembus persalinus]